MSISVLFTVLITVINFVLYTELLNSYNEYSKQEKFGEKKKLLILKLFYETLRDKFKKIQNLMKW